MVEVQCFDAEGKALRPIFKRVSGGHLPRVDEDYLVPDGLVGATVKAVRHNRFREGEVAIEVMCSTKFAYDSFATAGWGKLASAT